MTAISNLPDDLLKEILCRVPMTSLHAITSTCKLWNTLFKDHIFKEIMFITTYKLSVCLMSVNHDHNNKDLVYPFIKQIGELKKEKIRNVFHCSRLLLCLGDKGQLRVWNPYTGHQTSWIQPRSTIPNTRSTIPNSPNTIWNRVSTIWNRITNWRHRSNIKVVYGMGYDSNNYHKILKVSYLRTHIDCEIYDFKSRSWRIFDNTSLMGFNIYQNGVSFKGNNYFIASRRMGEACCLIICFDYTRETFRTISLPQYSVKIREFKLLSLVSEEKLAVLSWNRDRMEIWITNKIEPNAVSWSRFLKVDYTPFNRPFWFVCLRRSFFVDEKKKVAVIYYVNYVTFMGKALIIGEAGQYREVELGNTQYWSPQMCSSLMHIQ